MSVLFLQIPHAHEGFLFVSSNDAQAHLAPKAILSIDVGEEMLYVPSSRIIRVGNSKHCSSRFNETFSFHFMLFNMDAA